MGMMGDWVARMFGLETRAILRRILSDEVGRDGALSIEQLSRTGHRRKMIVARGDRRYVCHLTLKPGYCRTLAKLHELARTREVPVAPVLEMGTDWGRAVPVQYLVLGWMPGTPCDDRIRLTHAQLRTLGGILGRLHSITSDEWESVGRAPSPPINGTEAIRTSHASAIRMLSELEEDRSVETVEQSARWMRRNDAFLDSIDRFHLLHGDPHGNNVVVSGSNLALIDTDQMMFGFAPFELFRCLLANYTELDRGRQRTVLRGYREEVDERIWALWKRHRAYVAAAAFLRLGEQKRIRSRMLPKGEKRSFNRRAAAACWKAFRRITRVRGETWEDLEEIMTMYGRMRARVGP